MKAWVLGFVLFSLLSNRANAEPLEIPFEEISTLISKQHKAAKSSEEQIEAAKRRRPILKESFLPRVSSDIGLAQKREVDGSSANAAYWRMDLETNLYRAGADSLSSEIADNQIEIRQLDAQVFLRKQSYLGRASYINMVFLEKLLELNSRSKTDFDSLKKSIQVKINSGLSTASFLQIIAIASDDIQRRDIELRSAIQTEKEELCLSLGLDHDKDIRLTTNFEINPTQRDQIKAEMNGNPTYPDLRRLESLKNRIDLENKTKSEWWRPEIAAFASYGRFAIPERSVPGPLPEQELSLGLRLSINLESKRSFDRERFAKESDRRSLDLQKELLTEELNHKAEEQVREQRSNLQLLQSLRQSLSKTEKLTKTMISEFNRGLVNSSDVLTQIQMAQTLRRQIIEVEHKFFLAKNTFDSFTTPEPI